MAHKSGRQFFRMDVGETITSLRDDAMDEYHLEGVRFRIFRNEIYVLKSDVRAELSIARVQLTLENKQTMEGVVVYLLVMFSGIVFPSLSIRAQHKVNK